MNFPGIKNRCLQGLLLIFFHLVFCLSPQMARGADSKTTVISRKDINTMQAHTMADILNSVPGVWAGKTSVNIHGNFRVKVFVDGRPLNDPTSNHGGVRWDMITPDQVERIEILSGKGGVRYGQDASGGVILITTRKGSNLSGNLKTYGGSYDLFYANTNINWSKGDFATGIHGGHERTGGYLINNDKKRWRGGIDLLYSFNGRASISLATDYLDDRRGLSGVPEHPTPCSRRHGWINGNTLQADLYGVNSKTFFNRGKRHNTDISRNLDKTIKVSKLGQEINSSSSINDDLAISYGTAFSLDSAAGSGFSDQKETSFSVYTASEYALKHLPLELGTGLRYNAHSAFGNSISPEAKITWKNRNWQATLAYSRTDNIPSFYQRYNETSTTRPNPDLGMETADNFSLNIAASFGKTTDGTLRLFYNHLSNRITYVINDEGIGQYRNFGRVEYFGQDLTLNWKPLKSLQVKGSYTWLNARDRDTGLSLPAKAKHRGRFTITALPLHGLSIIMIFHASSKVYRNTANTKTVPGYLLADCKIEYDFKTFYVFGEINNLFNTDYHFADGLQGPPVTGFIGINYRF